MSSRSQYQSVDDGPNAYDAKPSWTSNVLPPLPPDVEAAQSEPIRCFSYSFQRKKVFVVAVVLTAVLLTLVAVLLAVSEDDEQETVKTGIFKFDDVFNSKYQPVGFRYQWSTKDPAITYIATSGANEGSLVKLTPQNQVEVLLSKDVLANYNYTTYALSPDERYALLSTEYEQLWRRSYYARYIIYDRDTQESFDLASRDLSKQRDAKFSPDGSRISFVRDNNVFYLTLADRVESAVTSDGKLNEIINGVVDWVYEEELLSVGLWWAPDSASFAYLRFDESEVALFKTPIYSGDSYAEELEIKYPKVGFENSKVTLFVYDVVAQESKEIAIQVPYEYIATVNWVDGTLLGVKTMNRFQNNETLSFIDRVSGSTTSTVSQTDQAWIDATNCFKLLSDGNYVDLIDVEGYNHLVVISQTGDIIRILTNAVPTSEVFSCAGFDPVTNEMFYITNLPARGSPDPSERYLYSVNVLSGAVVSHIPDGVIDAWYSASLSPQGGVFILNYQGPDIPRVEYWSTSGIISVLEDNAALRENLRRFKLPTIEIKTIPVLGEGKYAHDSSLI
eukprot:TRINITY_DN684_c1_g1_i2.p1 TRINITY_DN684_c1_g1~~TRINITY_DN684_c1_g1_i2.p1  ORF type:complete len:561 (-),score=126.62 TRINITY_DN684_c1_g1_i2:2246-3928(-)